jgi:aspartyl protease family protein
LRFGIDQAPTAKAFIERDPCAGGLLSVVGDVDSAWKRNGALALLARVAAFAVALSAIAVAAPNLAPGLLSAALHGAGPSPLPAAAPAPPVQPPALPAAPRLDSHHVALAANAEGHFVADAVIDGRTVPVMVDTGATTVALTDKTARRLGIYPSSAAYTERLATANGVIMAARVTLDEVRLGSVALRDVTAVIVPGNALPVDLLGMSFLGRLSKFEIAAGQLVLSQ